MPSFQARFFTAPGDSVPLRVTKVEAVDHAAAEALARAGRQSGEDHVEVLDADDEFRRGTPPAGRVAAGRAPDPDSWFGASQLQRWSDGLASRLSQYIRDNPAASIGAAVGLGFLLAAHDSRIRITHVPRRP